jgi:hypothetical protein
MSMEHKAYRFDHEGFVAELAPILYRALDTGDVAPLVTFVESNVDRLTDPYEGQPLRPGWQDAIATKDAHRYGDFALTAYYRAADDIGLVNLWRAVLEDTANEVRGNADELVLGTPFGPAHNRFDPGRMGSFFRSAAQVRADLAAVEATVAIRVHSETIDDLAALLRKAAEAGSGLYVTF